ncbi:hypothetical protein K0M31_014298 [Melipona bicolor]|uniref:Uncharacterized protein n=1 Tax=Melipona bicolor TaxID=60889 RepID=A0AA40KU12_9HYME|nr:hypothetical protein K0M31_014298 [Melipona bicolor]
MDVRESMNLTFGPTAGDRYISSDKFENAFSLGKPDFPSIIDEFYDDISLLVPVVAADLPGRKAKDEEPALQWRCPRYKCSPRWDLKITEIKDPLQRVQRFSERLLTTSRHDRLDEDNVQIRQRDSPSLKLSRETWQQLHENTRSSNRTLDNDQLVIAQLDEVLLKSVTKVRERHEADVTAAVIIE